jgi:hypothetical protein
MRTLFACAALVALAACNSEEPAEPAPAETQVALPVEPSMAPPDEAIFTAAHAEACPNAQPVSVAECKSRGLGKEGFICEYGLGDDEYLRNKATVVPVEREWVLAEPEKVCAADAA